jgi:hypothetical protein
MNRTAAIGAVLTILGVNAADLWAAGADADRARLPALTISRETTFIVQPLRADGTPDYVAWLDKEYGAGVTPENNAAIAVTRVLRIELGDDVRRLMGAGPASTSGAVWLRGGPSWDELHAHLEARVDARTGLVPGVGSLPDAFDAACWKQWVRAQRAPWTESEAPLIAAWLSANEAALTEIEAAAGRSRYWLPLPRELSMHTPIPSMMSYRQVVQALRARALLALARGDVKSAQRDLVTGLRLAGLVSQDALLVSRLMAIAMRGTCAEVVPLLAQNAGRISADSRGLLADLRRLPAVGSPADVHDVERLLELQALVQFYRAGRESPDAWRRAWLDASKEMDRMREGLGARALDTSAFERIPPTAIDWDEVLRTHNRWWEGPDPDAETAARRDLEEPPLGSLLAAAREDAAARRRVGRAYLALVRRLASVDDEPQRVRPAARASISWNESEALSRIGLVAAAAAAWRAEHGRHPRAASDIARGDSSPGFDPESDHSGYSFRYHTNAEGTRFAVSAMPLKPNETGVRGFCADGSGRLTETAESHAAAVKDGACAPQAKTVVGPTVETKP